MHKLKTEQVCCFSKFIYIYFVGWCQGYIENENHFVAISVRIDRCQVDAGNTSCITDLI